MSRRWRWWPRRTRAAAKAAPLRLKNAFEILMRDDIVRRYPFHRGNYTMQGNKVVSRNGTPPIETDQYTCLENSLYFGRPLMLLEQVILKFSSSDGWRPYDDTLMNQTFTVKMASRSHGKYDLSWQ